MIVITGLIGSLVSFFYSNGNFLKFASENKETNEELSKREEQRLIKENIKKYQPKETENTKNTGVDVAAKSAIVYDQNTNEIIYAKNIHEKMSPASIIKI
jgi:D-alanyl-D-alanine carboxypeptidase